MEGGVPTVTFTDSDAISLARGINEMKPFATITHTVSPQAGLTITGAEVLYYSEGHEAPWYNHPSLQSGVPFADLDHFWTEFTARYDLDNGYATLVGTVKTWGDPTGHLKFRVFFRGTS